MVTNLPHDHLQVLLGAGTAPLKARPQILVVDDDPTIRQALGFVLKDDYEVRLCASGPEALETVGPHTRAVILDIKMPGMDGMAVYEKVKETYPDLPVIFRSAYQDLEKRAEGRPTPGPSDQLFIATDDLNLLQQQVKKMLESLEQKVGTLEQQVAERTQQLETLRAQVNQAETSDKVITGGFAHELRNALQGARMPIYKALAVDEPDTVSLAQQNSQMLKDLYLTVRDYLPEDTLPGAVRLIREMNNNEKLLEEALQLAKSSLDRALSLALDFLDYSRAQRQEAGTDPVVVAGLLRAMELEVTEPFAVQGVAFRIRVETERPVPGRESHFYSLIKNFVNNARDAHLEAIAAGRPAPHWIEAAVADAGEALVITVADNGTGISEENQKKMFDAFFTTKTQGKGVGLGLSVVSRLVTLYQGRLQVESKLGEGTTFTVTLPYVRTVRAEAQA